jgi:hypothetical protein
MRQLRLWLSRLGPEDYITIGVVTTASLFVFSQLHPELIFANTTPAGGDMGAHVWGPAYMRDHLLPNFRLFGWAPSWYAGFPAFQFYFPLPSLLIVLLDVILPYGIAFKLISISGLVSLPVAAWAFGRLSGMRFPGPAVLAVATVPFLFDRGFTIYGGNIPSTLAGEFSFSISLSLALVFLGVVARGLDTGKHRALAAVLLAVTGLSHLLPTIFAVVGALVMLLLRPGQRRVKFVGGILAVSALLAAFWSFPFLIRLPYANNMGWEKITQYSTNLFPQNIRWVVVLAATGAILSVVFRRRTGLFFFGMATIAGVLFVMAPEGRLWNARVLPFYYLSHYLLAGVAVTEAGVAISQLFAADPKYPSPRLLRATPIAAALLIWVVVGLPLGVVPNWVPAPTTTDHSFIPDWAKWNYSGYERKDAYPEYSAVIETMATVGSTHGCGRAHWEYEANLDRFGTPMALMLLPYWTDGCIDSMEGLYFESSATTPYHFLSAGELSKGPSNPQRDLPYRNLVEGGVVQPENFDRGIKHLQMLGSRYYMAFSSEAVAQADSHPDLTRVAQTGRWMVYEVRGSELVTPLNFQPAVVKGAGGRGERPWLDLATTWFMDENAQDVFLAASGPKEWQRVDLHTKPTAVDTVGTGYTVDTPAKRPTEATSVRNIRSSEYALSFDVERPGTPMLVKVSYYPNWKLDGAKGPYRVTPNLMVVIPTSTHVEMKFGYTPVDVLGWVITLVGIAIVVRFARHGTVDFDPEPLEEPPAPADTRRDDLQPAGPAPDRPEPVTVHDRRT